MMAWKSTMFGLSAAACLALAGCAHKDSLQPDLGGQQQEESQSMDKSGKGQNGSESQNGQNGQQGGGQSVIPTPIPTPSLQHYLVNKGDSLWKISGKSDVFSDSFRWPLLFKANRDQIVDPDLIAPAQDLSFEKSYNPADVEEAVEKAKETPPYHPHTTPRKRLPVKY
jgi:hypothetical protein